MPKLLGLLPLIRPVFVAPEHESLRCNVLQEVVAPPALHRIQTGLNGFWRCLFGNRGTGFKSERFFAVEKPCCRDPTRSCLRTISNRASFALFDCLKATGQNTDSSSSIKNNTFDVVLIEARHLLHDHASHRMAQQVVPLNVLFP